MNVISLLIFWVAAAALLSLNNPMVQLLEWLEEYSDVYLSAKEAGERVRDSAKGYTVLKNNPLHASKFFPIKFGLYFLHCIVTSVSVPLIAWSLGQASIAEVTIVSGGFITVYVLMIVTLILCVQRRPLEITTLLHFYTWIFVVHGPVVTGYLLYLAVRIFPFT